MQTSPWSTRIICFLKLFLAVLKCLLPTGTWWMLSFSAHYITFFSSVKIPTSLGLMLSWRFYHSFLLSLWKVSNSLCFVKMFYVRALFDEEVPSWWFCNSLNLFKESLLRIPRRKGMYTTLCLSFWGVCIVLSLEGQANKQILKIFATWSEEWVFCYWPLG